MLDDDVLFCNAVNGTGDGGKVFFAVINGVFGQNQRHSAAICKANAAGAADAKTVCSQRVRNVILLLHVTAALIGARAGVSGQSRGPGIAHFVCLTEHDGYVTVCGNVLTVCVIDYESRGDIVTDQGQCGKLSEILVFGGKGVGIGQRAFDAIGRARAERGINLLTLL